MDSPTKKFLLNAIVGKYWFKGKGILVPVLLVLSWFLVIGLGVFIENYFGITIKGHMATVFMGFSLIVCGFFTWIVGRDFIKKDGKRIEVDLDNRFLFFKMKHVGIALIFIGSAVSGYGLYQEFISKLLA